MARIRPFVIVIAGPNGSGKTTLTTQILAHNWASGAEYINPDEIAKAEFGDWNNSESVLKAASIASERRYKALEEKRNFIFETVFSAPDKPEFILRCLENGYFVRFFFISTQDPMINVKRVGQRFVEGGHNVPIEKTISRYLKSISNSLSISRLVDRFYLIDNSFDGKVPKLIFRAESGKMAKQYAPIPQWAKSFSEFLNQ